VHSCNFDAFPYDSVAQKRNQMKRSLQPNTNHTDALLRVAGLSKQYVQRHPFSRKKFIVNAFQDVSLTISRGKTLAVVGESGAGKSTLARCIALLEPPTSGSIDLAGKNLLALDRKELFHTRRAVQLIHQDHTSALNPGMTACDIIAEPLVVQREGTKSQRRERALLLMEQVGLDPAWERKRPLDFSGGQRQRLAIARALALEPQLLILDEALSNLDASNQSLILNLLTDLQLSRSLTYLYISHDLRLVSQFADDVAVMCEGRIVEQEKTRGLFDCPKHPYTKELVFSMHSVESILLERSA